MDSYLAKVRKDFEGSPYWKFLGLEVKELREGHVELRLPYNASFGNVSELVHGGALASILDMSMGMLGRSLGYDKVMTLHMNIQFLKAVEKGDIYSEASMINEGRSTSLLQVKLYDEERNIVAHSTGTFRLTKNKEDKSAK